MSSYCTIIVVYILAAILSVYSSDDLLFISVDDFDSLLIKNGSDQWKRKLEIKIYSMALDKKNHILYIVDKNRRYFVMQLYGDQTISTVQETHGKDLSILLRKSNGEFCVDEGIFIFNNRRKISMFNSKTRTGSNFRIKKLNSVLMCHINNEENQKIAYLAYEPDRGTGSVISRCLITGDDCKTIFTFNHAIFFFHLNNDIILNQTEKKFYKVSRRTNKQFVIEIDLSSFFYTISGKHLYYVNERNITEFLKSKLPLLEPVYIPCNRCWYIFMLPVYKSSPESKRPSSNDIPHDDEERFVLPSLNNTSLITEGSIQANDETMEKKKTSQNKSLPTEANGAVDMKEDNTLIADIIIAICSPLVSIAIIIIITRIISRFKKIKMNSRSPDAQNNYYSSYTTNHNEEHDCVSASCKRNQHNTTSANHDTEHGDPIYLVFTPSCEQTNNPATEHDDNNYDVIG